MVIDLKTNENFTFSGFLPNQQLEVKCKRFYSLVDKKSPSACAKIASLTKVGDNYEAKLKIVSGSCSFEISSQNQEATESIDNLYKKFTDKILDWNKEKDVLCD